MRKIITMLLLTCTLLCTVGTVVCGASFGTGVEVVAKDVEMIKTGIYGQKLCFSDGDFKSAFCISNFKSITVTKLPSSTEGTLLIGGRRVAEGQTIKRRNLAALVFIPASADVKNSSFSFTMDGQDAIGETVCQIKFIDKVNMEPKIDDNALAVSLTTQEEISVYGKMSATDPDGDEIKYIVVAYPRNGLISVTDTTNGSFKYTPTGSFTGYDSFTYVARDEWGNYSEPTKVNIKVTPRMSSEVFLDMSERSEYNAAVAMSALGVMSGKILGDDSYFMPEETVTRAEFVAMAMKAYGIKADSTLTSSFFDDGKDIPASLVSYVATAERLGIVDGELDGARLVFNPNRAINKYGAAGIIASILDVKDSLEESVYLDDPGVPVWARSSVSSMINLGIFDSDSADYEATVTRADAAEYLYRMLRVK